MGKNKKNSILIISDEPNIGWLFVESLGNQYHIVAANSWREGKPLFFRKNPHLVILDINIESVKGLDILKEIKSHSPHTPVLLISADASVQNVVEAMKFGAYDYIVKPFSLEDIAKKIFEITSNETLSEKVPKKNKKREDLLFRSPQMLKVMDTLTKASKTNANILLLGESGTGKELLAQEVHMRSNRFSGPLIAINCTAIPEDLLESELFGYEKGAFTGATTQKAGRIELANNGTLFLDEVGDMPLLLQGKLLRVLEQRQIDRLGSLQAKQINIRLVSATNQNIERLISIGQFRLDLYYRLSVIPVNLPPLRERVGDLEFLAQSFLKEFSTMYNKSFHSFSPSAMQQILIYKWPGNVRELKNIIERAVILNEGQLIEPIHLQFNLDLDICSESKSWKDKKAKLLYNLERKEICEALKKFKGNRTKAAKYLSMSTRNLQIKIKKFSITHSDYEIASNGD